MEHFSAVPALVQVLNQVSGFDFADSGAVIGTLNEQILRAE